MLKPHLVEQRLRVLDSAVRLSLDSDGILAIIDEEREKAIAGVISATAADKATAAGRLETWNYIRQAVMVVPLKLERLDRLRAERTQTR
jgi:hypothetical protein